MAGAAAGRGGQLSAAVRWYLARGPGPLPHLFRILWPFLLLRDHVPEACGWVCQRLPAAGSLDPQARGELVWTALVAAVEVGEAELVAQARQMLGAEPVRSGVLRTQTS